MRIYVGNFPYQTTEDDLRKQFEAYGTVDTVTIIYDRETGRSKGFAFVEMPDAEATKAIDGLNGKQFESRALTVTEARPRPERTGGGAGGGRGGERGGGGYGGGREERGGGGRRW